MVWDEYGEGGGEGEPPEDDEGPEEPELEEEDEGPEEPEVDEDDEGPEEPELEEEDEGPEEPELEEEGEERDEELEEFFDELEKGEKVGENPEDGRHEHTEEGDKTSESPDERNDASLEDQEGGGEGKEHGDVEPCKEDDKGLTRGDAFERLEPPLSEADVKKNDEDISYVCRRLSEEEVRSAPKERLYFLRHYHWFLDWREELLEKLNPDELSNFREKRLEDKRKLAAIGDFFDNKITDISEREPEKCEKVLNRYEELLNRRYNALARIEPKSTQSERAEPQQEHIKQENSKPEDTLRITREEWAQREGDEKSVTMRAAMSGGESEGTRFEHSVERIQSQSPLGDTEGLVKRSEVRVEKEVAWDEDLVRRISFEMTRIREAYKTRTERSYAGLLELVEDVDKRIILTVAERGERKWLRDVDYVVETRKWWVDKKGVMHSEQCTQVFGYKETSSSEAKIIEAAVTDKVRMGVKKEDRISLETGFRSSYKVTAERGETGEEGENKPLATATGSIQSGENGRQKTALKFYHESGEKPDNTHAEQVIYRVVHLPLAENPEQTETRAVETRKFNESSDTVEHLKENTVSGDGSEETVEATDATEERKPEKVVNSNPAPETPGEAVEDKSRVEEVEESSEGSQERVTGNEALRFEDVFIVVEGRGRRRILPVLKVLERFVEGVRRNDGNEERYCQELRKRGAPQFLSGYLLRLMIYERRVPEEVFRAALEYLGMDVEKELISGDSSKPEDYIEPVEEKVSLEAQPEDADSASETELETRFEFLFLPSGKIVSLTKGEDDFWEIVNVINELLDFKYSIEYAESENYIVVLPDGKRYKVGPVGCFLVLWDGRKIAVMLPEPAIIVQKMLPDLREGLEKTVENIFKSEEKPFKYFRAFTTENDLLYVLRWWVAWHLSGLCEVTKEDVEEAVKSFESRLEKIVEMFSEDYVSLSRERVEVIRERAKVKYPEAYLENLSKKIEVNKSTLADDLCPPYRINKGILIKIYDALNLSYPSEIHANGKELLEALLKAKGERRKQKPERPWWEQPTGTSFIPNKEDFEKAYREAITMYKTKAEILRRIKQAGIKRIGKTYVATFLNNRFYESERIEKLLEIIGRKPEEVRELSLNELNDDDQLSLPEEGGGGALDLINHMKEKRKEERSKEKILEYVARKLSEEMQKKKNREVNIPPKTVGGWLYNRNVGMPKEMYLLVCSVFGVKPNESLHSRRNKYFHQIEREGSGEVNFRKPVKFRLKNGETIEIIENQGEFYVVTKDGKFPAEKYIHRIGEEGWGLTIIDYETEDGIYTLIKEMGELWLPDTQPWYITSRNLRLQVNPELLKSMIKTLQKALKTEEYVKEAENRKEGEDATKLKEISEITGTSIEILRKWTKGNKSVTLKRLLEFIAVQNALTGENIKKIIKRGEPQIKRVGRREVEEKTRKNMLYVNLGIIFGVALAGHTVADGRLSQTEDGVTEFGYYSTEYGNIERVNKLLEYFGQPGKIYPKEQYRKEAFQILTRMLIAQAIRRAIPKAVRKKTIANPPVSKRITDDKQKAIALLQSIMIDEANLKLESKEIEVGLSVDVTREIGEEFVNSSIELVRKKLKEIEPQKHLLKKTLYIFNEEKIKHINNKEEVRTVLEKAMKRLEQEGIQTDEDDFEKICEYLSKETKITRNTLKHYLHFIEEYVRQIGKNEVSSEMVRRAETKMNNILQAAIRAFKTLDINPKEYGIRNFHVSRDERITAHSIIYLSRDKADKAYKLGVIKGSKGEKYEAIIEYEFVQLFDKKSRVGILSENQINILESKKNKKNYVLYSKIKEYNEIVNTIENNKPKKLEEKYKLLVRNEIKARLNPLYIIMGKNVINVKWELASWPIHRGAKSECN